MIQHYNLEMINEILKCKDDVKYFAETYLNIMTPDGHRVPLRSLNGDQLQVLEAYKEQNKFFMTGRSQEGKTTIAAIIMLHRFLFESADKTSVIVSRTNRSGEEVVRVARELYVHMPEFLKIKKFDIGYRTKIQPTDDRNKIVCVSNIENLRGYAVDCVYFDEYHFIKDFESMFHSLLPIVASIENSKVFGLTFK